MAALPYMQLYVADYLGDTYHLTTEEHGAYLLILMTYWQSGKPIPKNRLAAAARMSQDRWTDVERTLNEFFTEDDNGCWCNARIESDLKKVNAKSKQASDAGKRSAAQRAEKKALKIKDKEALKESGSNTNKDLTDVERTLNHTDTDTDTDKRKESVGEKHSHTKTSPPKRTNFKPPTQTDVIEFSLEKNLSINGFYDYYESNGWMVGKNKMKDWRAAARRWSSNQPIYSGENNAAHNRQNPHQPKQSHHHKISSILDRQLEESSTREMG